MEIGLNGFHQWLTPLQTAFIRLDNIELFVYYKCTYTQLKAAEHMCLPLAIVQIIITDKIREIHRGGYT